MATNRPIPDPKSRARKPSSRAVAPTSRAREDQSSSRRIQPKTTGSHNRISQTQTTRPPKQRINRKGR